MAYMEGPATRLHVHPRMCIHPPSVALFMDRSRTVGSRGRQGGLLPIQACTGWLGHVRQPADQQAMMAYKTLVAVARASKACCAAMMNAIIIMGVGPC